MLVCWDAGIKDSWTKRLMFQVLFFLQSLERSFSKIVSIYFFIIKIKNFECPKSIGNNEKEMIKKNQMLGG